MGIPYMFQYVASINFLLALRKWSSECVTLSLPPHFRQRFPFDFEVQLSLKVVFLYVFRSYLKIFVSWILAIARDRLLSSYAST